VIARPRKNATNWDALPPDSTATSRSTD